MKVIFSVFLLILCASSISAVSNFTGPPDFFYIILQWPGSRCNTKEGCCYPKTVKPAKDFIISGLQPFNFDGTFPSNCNSHSHFNVSMISDLVPRLRRLWPSLDCPARNADKLWSSEWQKYGTCSESVFNEHQYFTTALGLQKRANLLNLFRATGIQPNGSFYDVGEISDTIVNAGLHFPGLVCNQDKNGNTQLNQIFLCSDTKGKSIVDCPGVPMGTCDSSVKFPSF